MRHYTPLVYDKVRFSNPVLKNAFVFPCLFVVGDHSLSFLSLSLPLPFTSLSGAILSLFDSPVAAMGCSASVQIRTIASENQPEQPKTRSHRLSSFWQRKSKSTADRPLYELISPHDFAAQYHLQERVGLGGFAAVWCVLSLSSFLSFYPSFYLSFGSLPRTHTHHLDSRSSCSSCNNHAVSFISRGV